MDWKEVESSNLAAVAHDAEKDEMHVKFKNGRVYAYKGVSERVFSEVIGGASVGRTFNHLVKSHPDRYPYRRTE